MKVGLLREKHKKGVLGRTLTYISNFYNIDFFVFTYDDVDLENETIDGLFFEDGQWVKKRTEFPDIVDNVPMDKRKYPEIFKALKKKAIFTTPGLGSKSFIFNKMQESKRFEDLIIPTDEVASYDDLKNHLQKYKKIVLKPTLGSKGRNIFVLNQSDEKIDVLNDDKNWTIEIDELQTFYNENISEEKYVAQPFIKSQTIENNPFDIRLHVRKNQKGQWEKVEIYPRIGVGKNITSNVSQGGGVAMLTPFLEHNFEKNWKDIRIELNNLCKTIPLNFEKLYNFDIDALGIDIGIEPDGKIWLFEVNTFPGQHFFYARDSEVRVAYYRYLLDLKNKK